MTTATDIRDFLSGIGIASYDEQRRTDAELRTELTELRAQIEVFGEIDTVAGSLFGALLRSPLGTADAALTTLEGYATQADPAERAMIAETAISEAETALADIIETAEEERRDASPEAMAFGFSVLHYATLVRQFVAATVQDGPLGAPGLHEQITTATTLLYDEITQDAGGEGLVVGMINSINRDIEAVDIVGTRNDTSVQFTIRSELAEISERFAAQVPSGLSEQEFSQLLANTISQQAGVVAEQVQQEAGISFMQAIGEAVNEYMPQGAELVAGTYERIGTEEANTEDGSDLAEYFQGLAGDDLLNGLGGPDNLSGGDGNDILRGGSFRDYLVGGNGNDLIFGADMRSGETTVAPDGDTARFFGLSSEYSVLGGVDYAVVTGPDGSRDKLFDVSFLRFDDTELALNPGSALDAEGDFEKLDKTNFVTAERVALLYEAALDRNGDIDLPGLNFYIGVTERDSLTDEFLAADLMRSPEFTEKFGDVEMMTNTEFLTRIYENVLDRTPDPEGLQFYLDLLNAETISRALALADISVSPENTQGSAEILMSLYETTAPVFDETNSIDIAWSFVA